mgnify:CR=1 FL=1
MCEHHHHHEHSKENDKLHLVKIILALILFILAIAVMPAGIAKVIIFLTAYIIAGGDVLIKAVKNIFKGDMFDENFLMVIATAGAFAIKEYPEAVMVMILYQIGEFLQEKAVEKSRRSISRLMDIRPDYANIEINGELTKVNPADVKKDDIITVKTGEKIPLDGTVIEGHASVDTSALTGESAPKELKAGDSAISGCINTNGLLKIKVEKEFGESTVSKILELVEHAGAKKAKAENFITKFARYYTPAVVAGAFILAVIPPLILHAGFSIWVQRALTFLVISCPCALVISVPLGFFAGIGGASKHGILIKGACYIEALSNPDSVVFDKTGTLTKGTFKVTEIHPEGLTEQELLKMCAHAENYSSHPIALSLKEAYGEKIDSEKIKEIEEIAGNGVKANIEGSEILAGNSNLMKMFNVEFPLIDSAGTIVYTAKNRNFTGYIVISDEPKEDAKLAINNLKIFANQTVMLTGDSQKTARYIAQKLGIDKFYAELLPAQKVEKLEELIADKEKNKSVIFAGDGINDAPVLTRADVGIAMGGLGSDAAIEAADIVIMDDKPSKIAKAVLIARKTMSIVKQNIIFALGIKALFLILGAFGIVTMWGAVFADTGVALLAVINSLRALKA